MKIVLVTSKITYVRDNYLHFLKHVSYSVKGASFSLVIIDNRSVSLFITAFLIMLAGARKVGLQILINGVRSLLKERENLFDKVIEVPSINSDKAVSFLKQQKPDLIINARTRDIYRAEVLTIPEKGCLNIHHGILPDNRGTMCDLYALTEGRKVGFSIHQMNERIDDGGIAATEVLQPIKKVVGIRDYTKVPMLSAKREAVVLVRMLQQMVSGKAVALRKNKSGNVRVTKNPDFRQIRDFRKKGWVV